VSLNQSESPKAFRGTGPGLAAGLHKLSARLSPDDGPLALGTEFASAESFITLFHCEHRAGPPDRRMRQVRREIEATGSYWHTADELAFGARVAWRNSSRCIGRLYWQSLRVRDRREVHAAVDVAAESVAHLREATNGGRIRPVITIFAPNRPAAPGPRILNSQVIQYAGYQATDGTITGDPANVEITGRARRLGWPGVRPAGMFDVLPLLVQEATGKVTLHPLPADAVLEVVIRHPEYAWFADLGLRWYAVPIISDMYLDIGGVCYPAAPFNGWYMCTEIGSRDLGDTGRYDQLPVIAQRMGLSTVSDRSLWKDKAMTELNLAVLHSFAAAGVTITDHHTESVRFLQHVEREERYGRACPADWTWIVPPAASSATAVFHRYYQDFDQTPNFYRHPSDSLASVVPPSQRLAPSSCLTPNGVDSGADAPIGCRFEI
jgi:nitric-oxide synthase, bacterial